MNIVIISNNYNSIKDGIGKYAKLIRDALESLPEIDKVYCATGDTADMPVWKKVLSGEMTHAIREAGAIIKRIKIDYIMMEYPFQEYNPYILVEYLKLERLCKACQTHLVLSVQEYRRAKYFRKKAVNFLADCSEFIFVSDEYTRRHFENRGKKVFIREMIGTVFPEQLYAKSDLFTYFGLINRSKAFAQMIQAWMVFNRDGKYGLQILTSSDVDIPNAAQFNITIHHGMPEACVAEALGKSKYAVIPVLPEVDVINGTFKTAALCGCVCIGHFASHLSPLPFVIQAKDYTVDGLVNAFQRAEALDTLKLKEREWQARQYGSQFLPVNTAKQIVRIFKNLK